MERRNAVLTDGITMRPSRIAFVFLPMIDGKLLGERGHVIVTIGFGEDRSGSDAHHFAIAFDDGRMRNAGIGREAIAVDEQEFGTYFQLVDGTMHGKKRSTQNVDLVNFLRRHHSYGPGNRLRLDDRAQFVTLMGRKLFAVVQLLVDKIFRQNDGRSINRTGQTAATGFVTSGFDSSFFKIRRQHDQDFFRCKRSR